MIGKVVLITGATDGLGKETARALARMGATVIAHGRNPAKAAKTVREIQRETGNANVATLLADLSSLQQTRDLAAQFTATYDRLDVLVNNAGAAFLRRRETVDGCEMTFALNHLSMFLLTNLLLDVIRASAPARIVNMASAAHYRGHIDFDDLQRARKKYRFFDAYGDSKLANVLFTYELARRLDGTGVTANALHPGFVSTNIGMNNIPLLGGLVRRVIMPLVTEKNAADGARTGIYLASSLEVEGVTGKFFIDEQETRSSDESYNEDVQRRLWAVSEALTGLA